MRNPWPLGIGMLLLFLAGCVTINVYFPAAAAQEAADRIIRDVYGETGTKKKLPPKEQKKTAPSAEPRSGLDRPLWIGLLEALVPVAEAGADIDVSSPAIRQLQAAMKARHRQLAPWYARGAIGMTRDGLIAVRDLKAVPLRDRHRLRQLVAAENRDRKALYAEIARVNGHPEWEGEIRGIFARRWIANAPAGWWYQDAGGNWVRK
ncbi:MAG: DUF1318 domain-containing protein [Gammaproteobacteria bacterium]|nr:MAG: DUF1318 domain-containing protein [Gammaproteobacteria bacterium]